MSLTDLVESCYVTITNTTNRPVRYYRSLNIAGKSMFWIGVGGGTSFLILTGCAIYWDWRLCEKYPAWPLFLTATLTWCYFHMYFGKRPQYYRK